MIKAEGMPHPGWNSVGMKKEQAHVQRSWGHVGHRHSDGVAPTGNSSLEPRCGGEVSGGERSQAERAGPGNCRCWFCKLLDNCSPVLVLVKAEETMEGGCLLT